MLILDNLGDKRGVTWRVKPEYKSRITPKNINDVQQDWCMLHFPATVQGRSVILVEDIASAEKMFPYYPCVALLGVNLNEVKMEYLLQQGINHVIIALDNDATRQAIRIARKWIVKLSILPLERDLKDETDERLKEIAEGISDER